MEEDIKQIQKKIIDFMVKYNVKVDIETTFLGITVDGYIAEPRVKVIIESSD